MASKSKTPTKATGSKAKMSSKTAPKIEPTSNSACVIIPPIELCDAIQEIRSANDTSFDRWPPHINLLWPFVPQTEFADSAAKIAANTHFRSIQPFTIRLSTFSYTRGSRYVHLTAETLDPSTGEVIPWPPVHSHTKRAVEPPTPPIQTLFSSLMEEFPGCERPFLNADGSPSQHFLPHLSVGQVEQTTIKETVAALQANWTPIEFEVSELTFLARGGPNKPFHPILTVPLETALE